MVAGVRGWKISGAAGGPRRLPSKIVDNEHVDSGTARRVAREGRRGVVITAELTAAGFPRLFSTCEQAKASFGDIERTESADDSVASS